MSIDVMKQALEALEEAANVLTWDGFDKAADALRAAIEQAQIHTSVFSNTHQCKQEPVAYIGTDGELGWLKKPTTVRSVATPLYTAEFTCSTGLCHYRKPLTDEQIDRVTDAQWASNNHKPIYAAHRAYARAIEAKIWDKK